DLDYGQWQGRTYEEVRGTDPRLFEAWFDRPHLVRFPQGEALQDLVARTADVLRLVIDGFASQADAVVPGGHDSANPARLLQLLDQPLSAYWRLAQSPCALSEIDIADGRVRVQRVNETRHLDGIG